MVENDKERKWCTSCCCFKVKRKEDRKNAAALQRQMANEFNEDQLLPYIAELNNLRVGQIICVSGYVNFKCRRFSINLICSQLSNADIAFHFNPRMEQRYVVRNCRIKGHWGDEETCTTTTFDFAVGRRFKVDILVAETEFMISVNGRHWCAFSYRLPLERIVGIEIRGKVDIQEVVVKDVTSYPVVTQPATVITVNDEEQKDKLMPFIGKLSKPLALGWALEICGRLKMLPQNFFINLQDGLQLWPHPIVPLHLNPRFCTTAGVDVFVRNSWLDGEWGQEERAPIFPFLSGADFKILIRREIDCFTIWVADKVVSLFKFRGGVEKIQYVYISGDLTVTNVTLREKKGDFQATTTSETETRA